MIRPLPDGKGVGFFSMEPVSFDASNYAHEKIGRYNNYTFTPKAWKWPQEAHVASPKVIDGFSPNLNKQLHVGHVRNLAIANAFSKMLPESHFVAILGTSLGVYQTARQNLARWFDFLDYHPDLFYDALMPWDETIVPREPGTGKNAGSQVLVANGQEIVLFRSTLVEFECTICAIQFQFYVREADAEKVTYCPYCQEGALKRGKSVIKGRPSYVYHDLAFAALAKPDHYVTGCEQIEHFKALGLGDKHLPMGLVCDGEGKKLKSREGDAMLADEMMEEVRSRVAINSREDRKPDIDKLAWNVICWHLLHCSRTKNVNFDPGVWTSPNSPGLYISYTYARLKSAIAKLPTQYGRAESWGPLKDHERVSVMEVLSEWKNLTEMDVNVLGFMEYSRYWMGRAIEIMDTAPFANYVHDFCHVLTDAYSKERIMGGRLHFQAAMMLATDRLAWCMQKLGMFPLEEV